MTQLIPLKSFRHPGHFALIDDADAELINERVWNVTVRKNTKYAFAFIEGKCIYMHRFLMKPAAGVLVDHKNGNGLDNRRSNLRPCDHCANGWNRNVRPESKSGYIGVYPNKFRWNGAVWFRGKRILIGSFKHAEDAARARDLVAVKYHGEFAKLNFPRGAV